ncbi:MFS transporter [Streptomyces sp. SID8367]|nr:MFS transporter [Streptomyces sp. SID8367]
MGSTAMALTTASAFSVHAHWPWPSTLALVLGAALSSPPLNAALRSSWRRLIPDPTHLKTVHTADSILEEAGFVVAPLTAGALLALLGPIPAYEAAVAAFLTVITCYLVAARTWELIPTAPPAGPPRTGTGQRAYRWLGPLAQPTLLMILIPMLVMGCLFGGTGIYVPAYLQHQHTPALIGPLLASLSAGGVVGGLLYAALPTGRIPLWRLYRLLTAGFAAPACLLPLAHTPWLLAVLLAASGLFVTPLFITAFLLVDAHATDDVRTEANSWIPASTDVANGIVAAIIGAMAARAHFTSALTLLAACAAGGILAAVLLPTPKNPAPAKTPQTAPASPPSGSTTAART